MLTLQQINALDSGEFIRVVGPVFEHSPWIAETAWAQRPFPSVEELHTTLCAAVRTAGEERQLSLIRAHPDLVGRLALAGQLTRESIHEQSSAGLDQLTAEEVALFQKNNATYQARFGFPFVVCARLNNKTAILSGFQTRLQNSPDQEAAAALEEIYKIAGLRLRDVVKE